MGSGVSGEALLLLAVAVVVIWYFYEGLFGKVTDGGMFSAYKQHEKSLGRIISPNHTTTKQGKDRVRWRHQKLDELMVRDFGEAQVQKFYQEHKIIEQRKQDFKLVEEFKYGSSRH